MFQTTLALSRILFRSGAAGLTVFCLTVTEAAQPPVDLSKQVDAKIDKVHSDEKAAEKAALEKRRTQAFQEAGNAIQAAATAQAGKSDAINAEKNIDVTLTQLGAAKADSMVFTDFLNAEIEAQGDRKIALNSMQDALQAQAEAHEAIARGKKAEIEWLEIRMQEIDVKLPAGAPEDVAKQTEAKQKELSKKGDEKKKDFDKASADAKTKKTAAEKTLQSSFELAQKADMSEAKVRTFALRLHGVSEKTRKQQAKPQH